MIVEAGIFSGVADLHDRGRVIWYVGFGWLIIVLALIYMRAARQTNYQRL